MSGVDPFGTDPPGTDPPGTDPVPAAVVLDQAVFVDPPGTDPSGVDPPGTEPSYLTFAIRLGWQSRAVRAGPDPLMSRADRASFPR